MASRWEDFLPEVLPYVPGCPEAVAVNAIRTAAIEFCRRSLWLLYEHDPVTVEANVGDYELDLPQDTELAKIWQATYDTYCSLTPVADASTVVRLMSPGVPFYIKQIDTYNVRLIPAPSNGGKILRMTVAIKPSRDSVSCEDSLLEHWAEKIGYGARARIHMIPGQPFSSPDVALKLERDFGIGIGQAIADRNRGLTRATLTVTPPGSC